jgi:hypothetical protein
VSVEELEIKGNIGMTGIDRHDLDHVVTPVGATIDGTVTKMPAVATGKRMDWIRAV